MAVFGKRKENQHLEEHLQRVFEAARNEGQDDIANQVHGLLCQLLQTKVDQCLRSLQPQEALAYAKQHVEIAPPHNGFSLLSKTYCILAYYREAEALARCGLLKVTLDHREAMQHFIHTARVHYAKRRDPVHHLPAEIMAGIMQYILQERITCLGVSRNWRHRLQLLPIWQTLEVVKWLPRQERNAHCMRTVLRPELRNIVWASNVSLCWFLSKLTQHQCNRIQKLGTCSIAF
ncbi:hypothetical protein BCR43DRAFT_499774 [Syncephalastrum racemosum]|uniref:F-box domain-containing protein n=1 Tax=Syncephalastrum racemosum TaxID=13706 RepID=A0A1X2GZJ5_SYNRA|nr:hypothetical protein BCR43DRAFT_499774 [Syncephalastrum racemosum]